VKLGAQAQRREAFRVLSHKDRVFQDLKAVLVTSLDLTVDRKESRVLERTDRHLAHTYHKRKEPQSTNGTYQHLYHICTS
jgi:hypothetical protein